jgi:rhodanese-related sulfurtransferase
MDPMPPQVGLEELSAALAAGLPLLDVREADEYEVVRVAQAVLIPLGDVTDRLAEIAAIAQGGSLHVICASGGRSNRAAAWLRQQGIDARNVAGGTNSWHLAGHPIESGPINAPGPISAPASSGSPGSDAAKAES